MDMVRFLPLTIMLKFKMTNTSRYHHGNLREQLLNNALELLENKGIDALSMRKLGEQLGVSRSALYHHFSNKQELLAAIASLGFERWRNQCQSNLDNAQLSEKEKLRHYVTTYFQFSIKHPQIYDLMFGKTIWGNDKSTQQLKTVAYDNFHFHLTKIKHWQELGVVDSNQDSLRLAQVSWGALHGISRLFIDGIYINPDNLNAMAETIVNVLTSPT